MRDREGRATYRDIAKQVGLVVRGIENAINQENPPLEALAFEHAYAFRDSLRDKGNSISTIERRMNTVNAVLNHSKKRFKLTGWDNPFYGIELPQEDGTAGVVKRSSISLDELRKAIPYLDKVNSDARDIWLLMVFTGAGLNEIRGLLACRTLDIFDDIAPGLLCVPVVCLIFHSTVVTMSQKRSLIKTP